MKKKIVLSVIGVVLSISLLVISIVLAEEKLINPIFATTFIFISTALVFASIFHAAKIDYEVGIYECKKCKHTFKPSFKAYILGAHTLTTRHLKCPKCGERSWCKRETAKTTR